MSNEYAALPALAEDWDTALAVVAHPDDMEYGAAAAVARWTAQGKKVAYLLVTRGEAGIDSIAPEECARLRSAEEIASAKVVGVETVEFLDHPDGVVEYGVPLRRDIAAAIRRHQPQVVLGINFRDTWGGRNLNMADHRNVGLATLDAARDAGNRWIFPDAGEPWDGVRMVCFGSSPESTHKVDVRDTIELGVASLAEHKAYLDHVGHDSLDWLRRTLEENGVVTFEVWDV